MSNQTVERVYLLTSHTTPCMFFLITVHARCTQEDEYGIYCTWLGGRSLAIFTLVSCLTPNWCSSSLFSFAFLCSFHWLVFALSMIFCLTFVFLIPIPSLTYIPLSPLAVYRYRSWFNLCLPTLCAIMFSLPLVQYSPFSSEPYAYILIQ
jgi:hypothetical protein